MTKYLPLLLSATLSSLPVTAETMLPTVAEKSTAGSSVGPLPQALDLTLALTLALAQNPQLMAYAHEVNAREAATRQAGLWRNPEFGSLAENFGNSRLRGYDGSATTWQLSQVLELGGKRAKRVRLAGYERDLAAWDYETKRLDVITVTRQAFYQVLAGQRRVSIASDLSRLAAELLHTVAGRVRAGKVAPLEQDKAAVAAKTAELQLQQARNDLSVARSILSAQWGDRSTRFDHVVGDLNNVARIPEYSTVLTMIKQNPDVARWVTELDQRKATLVNAEATRVPDLTFTAGVREFWNTGDMALVTGISLPLPLFDRSQGRIQEALQRLAKAHEEQRAAEVNAHSALERAYRSLAVARNEALTLGNELLPVANRAFKAASEGYRQGKFGYLEVLDAQRTFFETQARYLNALVSYQLSVAELERLVGIRLEDIGKLHAPTS